jgi:hypothetical protein
LVADLGDRVAELEGKLGHVSVSGNDITISGANLYVNNGAGSTAGPVNGLGNVIIGYNETSGSGDDRSGSHNLVVGSRNNYSSYGGLVAGTQAALATPFSLAARGDGIALDTSTTFSLNAGTTLDLRASGTLRVIGSGNTEVRAGNNLTVNGSIVRIN